MTQPDSEYPAEGPPLGKDFNRELTKKMREKFPEQEGRRRKRLCDELDELEDLSPFEDAT